MPGESVEMRIEEIEEQDGRFCIRGSHASFDRIFYGEDLSGKGGVAFDKGIKLNIFWAIEHLLAEGVTERGDVAGIEEQPPLFAEPVEYPCARNRAQDIDARHIEPGFTDEFQYGRWSLKRVAIKTVNKTSVKAYSGISDGGDGPNQLRCPVLVFFVGPPALRLNALYADKQCPAP